MGFRNPSLADLLLLRIGCGLGYRKAVIDFLYTRQGHVEKAA